MYFGLAVKNSTQHTHTHTQTLLKRFEYLNMPKLNLCKRHNENTL